MTKTALYRHFAADGTLLYVGITADLAKRTKQHQRKAQWAADIATTEAQWFDDRAAAVAAEARAIVDERPRFNLDHSNRDDSEFAGTAARIKALRVASGLSQSDFAASLGFNVTQYANWEVGFRQPTITAAITICEKHGLTLDWIFRGRTSTQESNESAEFSQNRGAA